MIMTDNIYILSKDYRSCLPYIWHTNFERTYNHRNTYIILYTKLTHRQYIYEMETTLCNLYTTADIGQDGIPAILLNIYATRLSLLSQKFVI